MAGNLRYESNQRSKARGREAWATGEGMQLALDSLIDSAKDLTSAWPAIGEVWHERQLGIFASESNGRWAPLKLVTILRKRRENIVPDSMVETGLLRREMSSAIPRSQSWGYAVYGPRKGAVIEYARYHARGEGGPQRNPAPRLTPTERRRMVEKMREHMGLGRGAA